MKLPASASSLLIRCRFSSRSFSSRLQFSSSRWHFSANSLLEVSRSFAESKTRSLFVSKTFNRSFSSDNVDNSCSVACDKRTVVSAQRVYTVMQIYTMYTENTRTNCIRRWVAECVDRIALMRCLHDPANVQQTSSKCNARRLLDVWWIV